MYILECIWFNRTQLIHSCITYSIQVHLASCHHNSNHYYGCQGAFWAYNDANQTSSLSTEWGDCISLGHIVCSKTPCNLHTCRRTRAFRGSSSHKSCILSLLLGDGRGGRPCLSCSLCTCSWPRHSWCPEWRSVFQILILDLCGFASWLKCNRDFPYLVNMASHIFNMELYSWDTWSHDLPHLSDTTSHHSHTDNNATKKCTFFGAISPFRSSFQF